MAKQVRQRGATLIELIIVIMLLAILAVGTNEVLRVGFKAYLTGQGVVDADSQGRLALARITRDLRAIRSPSDITNAAAGSISFTDINGTAVTYQVSGTQLMRNTQVLADYVQSASFQYYNENGVLFTPTASTRKDIRYIAVTLSFDHYKSFSLTAGVSLWNLI